MAANVGNTNNNNNNNNPNPTAFWEFIQSLDPNRRWASAPGEGVDHAQPGTQTAGAFPFSPSDFSNWGRWVPHGGPWDWSGHGLHGPRSRPWGPGRQPDSQPPPDNEDGSPETQREEPQGNPGDSPLPHDPQHQGDHAQHPSDGPPRGPTCRGRGRRPCGRDDRRRSHNRPHHGPHHGPHPPPPYFRGFAPPPWMHALQNHPLARPIWNSLQEQPQARGENDEGAFSPPIDIFNRPTEWQVHVAVPGTKKEDIGVDWDADKSTLKISGVVHRPGDEEFLQSLTIGERRVGLFNRTVKLPPEGTDEKDEIDANEISAKLDSGVLVVTVPKVEKEWTEILRVDID